MTMTVVGAAGGREGGQPGGPRRRGRLHPDGERTARPPTYRLYVGRQGWQRDRPDDATGRGRLDMGGGNGGGRNNPHGAGGGGASQSGSDPFAQDNVLLVGGGGGGAGVRDQPVPAPDRQATPGAGGNGGGVGAGQPGRQCRRHLLGRRRSRRWRRRHRQRGGRRWDPSVLEATLLDGCGEWSPSPNQSAAMPAPATVWWSGRLPEAGVDARPALRPQLGLGRRRGWWLVRRRWRRQRHHGRCGRRGWQRLRPARQRVHLGQPTSHGLITISYAPTDEWVCLGDSTMTSAPTVASRPNDRQAGAGSRCLLPGQEQRRHPAHRHRRRPWSREQPRRRRSIPAPPSPPHEY